MVYEEARHWPFTEKSLIEDIRKCLTDMLDNLESKIFGVGTLRPVFGLNGYDNTVWRSDADLKYLSVPSSIDRVFNEFNTLHENSDRNLINPYDFPITLKLRLLYDYVAYARWPKGIHLDDIYQSCLVFTEMLETVQEYDGAAFDSAWRIRMILEMSKARGKIDAMVNHVPWIDTIWTQEGYLSLNDVAILANVDERTIRNAIKKGLLNKYPNHDEGEKEHLDPEEVDRWLQSRSSFEKTDVYELPSYRERERLEEEIKKEGDEEKLLGLKLQCWQLPENQKAEVIDLVQIEKPIFSAEISVTANNIKSSSLRISKIFDRMKPQYIGGSNKKEIAAKSVYVEFSDDTMAITDIDGQKKILRCRGEVKRFYENEKIMPGDVLTISLIADDRLRVSPKSKGGK